jgi:hypothetical protein
MPASTVRTARRERPCGSYPCYRTIKPGDRYRRHVAFPGDEGNEQGTRPWVIEECESCAAAYGRPIATAEATHG